MFFRFYAWAFCCASFVGVWEWFLVVYHGCFMVLMVFDDF